MNKKTKYSIEGTAGKWQAISHFYNSDHEYVDTIFYRAWKIL